MRWLKKFFFPRVLIVEIESPRPQNLADFDDSVKTLALHPGFQALHNDLRRHSAQLQSRLQNRLDAPIDEIRFLQSGVYWCNWLNRKVNEAVYKTKPVYLDPNNDELKAIEVITSNLQMVGE